MKLWRTELVDIKEENGIFEVKNHEGKLLGHITPPTIRDFESLVIDLDDGSCPVADGFDDGFGNTCSLDGWEETKIQKITGALLLEGIVKTHDQAEYLAEHVATVHEEKTLVEYVKRMFKEDKKLLAEGKTWKEAARTWYEEDLEYYYFESELGVISIARSGSIRIPSTHIGSVV